MVYLNNMNVLVDSSNGIRTHAIISFDIYGNMYIADNYQMSINETNTLYLEYGNYNKINDGQSNSKYYCSISQLQEHSTLLKKSIKDKLNENDENSDDTNPAHDEDSVDYYPENVDMSENSGDSYGDIDEDNQKQYGEQNLRFKFWFDSSQTNNLVNERNSGDIMALYDVYMYDNNNLIFKSASQDNSSIYVIKININGDIYFRPIGHNEKKYRIKMSADHTFNIIAIE